MPAPKKYLMPHPSVYILDEMNERHWDRDVLAYMMVCGLTNTRDALKWYTQRPRKDWESEWGTIRLSLDFYFEVGPTDTNLRMGDSALKFARAFGTSDEFFLNLENAWLRERAALESPPADAAVDPHATK